MIIKIKKDLNKKKLKLNADQLKPTSSHTV